MATPSALSEALSAPALAKFSAGESFSKREEITTLVAENIRSRRTAELLPRLEEHQIWHARVDDYDDLPANPQLKHLGAFITETSAEGAPITLLAHPARYDGESPGVRLVPQKLGAQTRAIAEELGYSRDEIEDLCKRGVVRCAESA
jgi:crotonobetainyl-CoA:carnitine CoA-transferase CaiB-like acyl-CoA transferase